ncbi:MAG: hypothetical protein AB1508_09005 [Pseudomonadota bacterium]
MGLELFTIAFRDKDVAPYPRSVVEDIFNRDALEPHAPLVNVLYADSAGEIYGADEDEITGIMVAHFGGPTILERVFELAVKTNSLICWTSGAPRYGGVTSREMLDHLPDGIDRAKIAIIQNVDEFLQAYTETPESIEASHEKTVR